MAGFLINDKDDNSDLISLIPYWGARGIIKIQEIPKNNWLSANDTILTRLQMLPDNAPEYEKKMFKGLFGSFDSSTSKDVKVSSLKNTFYTTMAKSRTLLNEKAQPYYEADSKSVKNVNLGMLVVLAIVLFPLVLFIWGLLGAFAVLLTCIVLAFVNVHMVKKNSKGNQVFAELKGFKKFVKVAEENKLKMLLSEDPTYFESTMSYALAFGLFDRWSKKFDALHMAPPSWYSSQGNHHMNMNNFSRSFSGAMSSAQSTMVSAPSSSSSGGGGSSGGGFGGGGGGSW
ncbi:putative membrane protein DUF2207 [Ulvibacter sp. MAR_2010_11]|uniref:DUF2207 family protein n=1 Tax=Ulvibacter sp. MAR_2010_11 TaxID=1250229 RepID=UPI000C2B9CC0|nr:DUF2207 domain-containing protein [Ulvibacter sp. MAR_2010_11]PKA83994.1 putative membrane protein DUF2207 [Ulvibacter sp. MAR_2010_11]